MVSSDSQLPNADRYLIEERTNNPPSSQSYPFTTFIRPNTTPDVNTASQHRNTQGGNITDSREGRFHFAVWRGIHMKSPFLMTTLLLLGVVTACGHHGYYTSLDTDQVGTESQQQWSLRFGSAFAHMTQIFLVASVGVAYTQWLWKTLISTDISVECLDSAFDADTAIVSLLNRELIRKIKVGAFLALICWCLQLPSLITPATLSVLPTIRLSDETYKVTSLDMYSGNQTRRFALSIDVGNTSRSLFLGPRTVVARLVTATATEGVILPIVPPFVNSTYSVGFYGPAIRCDYANQTVTNSIISLQKQQLKSHTDNVTPVGNYYYGFVPNLKRFGDGSEHNGVEVVPQTRLKQPMDASNELWMVFARYRDDQLKLNISSRKVDTIYTTCQLWNVSYILNLTFQEGIQNISRTKVEYLNTVAYPEKSSSNSTDSMIQHAYSAVMWAISDLLVGEMVLFNTTDPSYGRTQFGEINSQIAHTSLLGSSDLRYHFDKNREMTTTNQTASDQTLVDMDLAGNHTLPYLIEELGFNVTMSFMNSRLLSPNTTTPTQVRIQKSINTYSYSSRNLFLAYGLAILFAVIANVLGAYAFWKNKASHSRTFSARVLTRKGDRLQDIVFDPKIVLKAPLNDQLMKMRVRFSDRTWGFEVAEPAIVNPVSPGGREPSSAARSAR